MTTTKLKVYELAKELSEESHSLVETIQRLGIDIKGSTSILGTEEVKTVREHYRKQRASLGVKSSSPAKPSVTEKRVGSTVIRRRAAKPGVAAKTEPILEAKVEPETEAELESTPVQVAEVEAIEAPAMIEAEAAPIEEVIVEEIPQETERTERELKPSIGKKGVPSKPVIEEKKARRFFPSIIKKIGTEQHLTETIGNKVEKKERPKTFTAPVKPKTDLKKPETATGPSTSQTLGGFRKVKEVELIPAETAKEGAKRRIAERQDSIFKSADFLKRELVHATKKKKGVINRPSLKTMITTPAEHKRVVTMKQTITVAELAKELGIKSAQLITKLMGMGVTATINQALDLDTTTLVAQEFKHEVKQQIFDEKDFLPTLNEDPEKLKTRSPVVTIMGHVDHGKTSLLDAIRKTQVAAGEAGGITQHIGAYTVDVKKGKITFVDTPGHEAFTAMRARGAKVTDIVVLVVSAVDGVMPQTLESVNHAQAAQVPIVVAVNKIDLPDANADRIKQTLAGHGLNPEEWGGETIYVNVSAKTGKGLDVLLENILLQAEMLELKANPDAPARGIVVEAKLDKARGPVATVLIQHGTLKVGDILVCGSASGKVRSLLDSYGKKLNQAGPSEPVEILGLAAVPQVGDECVVMDSESKARELTTRRGQNFKEATQSTRTKQTLETLMATPTGEKELRLVLKADVQGSAEALKEALLKIPSDKAKVKLLHFGTGGITESDVMLASASGGAIVGFNIRPDIKAIKLAEAEKIEIRTFSIIYDLLENVKGLMEGLLDKQVKEKVIGRAEVREVFSIPKIGAIAGSAVIDGKVTRGCFLRLLRDSRVIYEGKISSLKRFKDDVKEVNTGFECGIGLENFNDIKQGDQFEAFLKEEIKVSL